MDNLTKRNQPDRSKINMSEDFEVKHWLKALGVSRNGREGRKLSRGSSQGAGCLTKAPGVAEPLLLIREEQALTPGTG